MGRTRKQELLKDKIKTCPCCGKEFTGRRSEFCSDKCHDKKYRDNHKEELRAYQKARRHKLAKEKEVKPRFSKFTRLTKLEQQQKADRNYFLEDRRLAINNLVKSTGLSYGIIASYYDNGDMEGLKRKLKQEQEAGRIYSRKPANFTNEILSSLKLFF